MRIICGKAGGRKLRTPRGPGIRPTSDRVKEALFSILGGLLGPLDGCSVLDIFAGTGNLGIEALSRGAMDAVFIDNSRDSTNLIARNLEITGFAGAGKIIAKNFTTALASLETAGYCFQLIFLDPPYGRNLLENALDLLGHSTIPGTGAIVVAESSSRDSTAAGYGSLMLLDKRVYGDTALSFYKNMEKSTS